MIYLLKDLLSLHAKIFQTNFEITNLATSYLVLQFIYDIWIYAISVRDVLQYYNITIFQLEMYYNIIILQKNCIKVI